MPFLDGLPVKFASTVVFDSGIVFVCVLFTVVVGCVVCSGWYPVLFLPLSNLSFYAVAGVVVVVVVVVVAVADNVVIVAAAATVAKRKSPSCLFLGTFMPVSHQHRLILRISYISYPSIFFSLSPGARTPWLRKAI